MPGIASAIFAGRNFKKAAKGDWGRYSVAAAQAANVTNAAADSSINFVAKSAKGVLNKVDNVGESIFKVADASGKIAKFTSKAVNPLLVGAAGIRVLKDDNKKARAIEEGAALGAMFTGEKIFKLIRNTINGNLGKTLSVGQKVIKNKAVAGKLAKVATAIGKFIGGSSLKGKALFILAELAFVGTSILCYDLGKKLGTKLSGRNEQNQAPVQNTEKKGINALA